MDAGVGPAGDGELGRRAQEPAEGVPQDALDGALVCLVRPAPEPGAVVAQREPDDSTGRGANRPALGRYSAVPTSSIRAIGAASPRR